MMFAAVSCNGEPPISRSFHASAVIGENIYIHGGIDKGNSVLSSLHCFNTMSKTWSKVDAVTSHTHRSQRAFAVIDPCESPHLSHHCALTYMDRFIILIGGWNGKKRTPGVFVFDITEKSWFKMHISGDIPVGLSSHTANVVSENLILIIGREGGVHTHRRSGDAFTLNPKSGEYKQATYAVDSRSGHISCLVKSNLARGYRLFVYSGRKTGHQYSFIGSWSSKYSHNNDLCDEMSKNIISLIQKSPVIPVPDGRQNCKSFSINDKIVLIYGGQLWQARDFVTADTIAFNSEDLLWHKLPQISPLPKLTGFTLDIGNDGQCYIFGGNDGRISNNILWNLQTSK